MNVRVYDCLFDYDYDKGACGILRSILRSISWSRIVSYFSLSLSHTHTHTLSLSHRRISTTGGAKHSRARSPPKRSFRSNALRAQRNRGDEIERLIDR